MTPIRYESQKYQPSLRISMKLISGFKLPKEFSYENCHENSCVELDVSFIFPAKGGTQERNSSAEQNKSG